MFLILTNKELSQDVVYETARIDEKEANNDITSYLKINLRRQNADSSKDKSYNGICLILPNKDDVEERNVVIEERNK